MWDEPQEGGRSVGKLLKHSRNGVIVGMEVKERISNV